MKLPKLPQVLFVTYSQDHGNEEPYLITDEAPEDSLASCGGSTAIVGRYELKERLGVARRVDITVVKETKKR